PALGMIARVPGGVNVTCLDKQRSLERVAEEDANAFMDETTFEGQQPAATPLVLGVDAAGEYTLVDVVGNKHRVFVGHKGKMRRVDISSVEGRIDKFLLHTPQGTLSVVIGQTRTMDWVEKPPLTMIDVTSSWHLVFDELGVYPTRTPTPCD